MCWARERIFFHRQPGSYCAKPAQIWFGSGWLCQVWAKQIQSRSKLVCRYARIIWPMLPSWSGSDANLMRIGSGIFTGRQQNTALTSNWATIQPQTHWRRRKQAMSVSQVSPLASPTCLHWLYVCCGSLTMQCWGSGNCTGSAATAVSISTLLWFHWHMAVECKQNCKRKIMMY